MKKIFKKLLTGALALSMIFSAASPVSAAQSVPAKGYSNLTLYMDPDGSYSLESFYISGLSSNQTIKATSLKSSKPGVASLYRFRKTTTTEVEDEYYYDTKEKKNVKVTDAEYRITMKINKAGTTKFSYKVGSTTYATNIIVKKYVNPIKTLKVTGVNKGNNIAGKANTSDSINVSLGSNVKLGKINVTAKAGWKINSIYFYDRNSSVTRSFYSYSNPVSSAILYTGNLKKTGRYYFSVDLVNTSNGGTISTWYYIN